MAKHPSHANVFCGCFGRCLVCNPLTDEEKAKLAELKIDFRWIEGPVFLYANIGAPAGGIKDVLAANSLKEEK
jgi:hypothetical protein